MREEIEFKINMYAHKRELHLVHNAGPARKKWIYQTKQTEEATGRKKLLRK